MRDDDDDIDFPKRDDKAEQEWADDKAAEGNVLGFVDLGGGLVLDPLAPRTNAILGALLSGGDPIKLAKMLVDK